MDEGDRLELVLKMTGDTDSVPWALLLQLLWSLKPHGLVMPGSHSHCEHCLGAF